MPEDGQQASSAARAVSAGWPPGRENARPGPAETAARPGPAETAARLADWAPWLIACAVFAVYTPISVFRYLQLNPSSWDLGIFTEVVKQYAHLGAPVVDIRGAGVTLLGDHFSPVVALIAPFFLIVPSSVTLLVAQALLVAVSVVPVTRTAGEKLGRRAGWAAGAAYGFSWGLQQMIDFDFHEIAFAVPLLAFSMSALLRGRTRAAVAWALPLVFVKEDQGFTVAAIGLLVIIVSRWRDGSGRAAIRGGQLLIVWGIAWSVVSIAVIIPHFNLTHHYQYWSDGGTLSPGGHFSITGLFRQLFTSWPTKLQTILMILLPTAFIALRSPLALAALPSVALRFLGTSPNFWSTDWHYNATVMPILFIAAVDAIARIRASRAPLGEPPPAAEVPETPGTHRALEVPGGSRTGKPGGRLARPGGSLSPLGAAVDRHGAAAMLAIALALIVQFPVRGLWNPQTYRIDQHVADATAAMARVPDGATVTTTLDLLAPLAARTDTFWIGNAGNPNTAYIVFDGANSGYTPPPSNIPAFVASQHPGVAYRVIYDIGDVYVFRRAGG